MHTRKPSGFTLIELLVVIAIIAVLAAILFPVFAQARAKAREASCQSNMKQSATAIMMYVQDYDETMPLAMYWTTGWISQYQNYSYNLPPGAATDPAELSFWIHAIVPYVKNNNIYTCPQMATGPIEYDYDYNGLLHAAPMATIQFPATVPLMWEGMGNYSNNYDAYSLPYLSCPNGGPDVIPCLYVPPSTTCDPNQNGQTSYTYADYGGYVHAQGLMFSFADGHVKNRILGPLGSGYQTFDGGLNDIRTQPFNNYDNQGYSYSPNVDSINGCHVNMFRPDMDPAAKP